MSLVEHSPSTVMALKVSSAAALSARCSNAGVTAASVVMNPSIVAMFGSIMPEPLAMPPTRKLPVALVISTDASLGNGSVVMIARAASAPPLVASAAAACRMPRATSSIGELDADDPGRRHEHVRSGATDRCRRAGGHRFGVLQPIASGTRVGASAVDHQRGGLAAALSQVTLRQQRQAPLARGWW